MVADMTLSATIPTQHNGVSCNMNGVNLAARLESACKQYTAQILLSESTYRQLKGTYQIRDVDKVIVKGKTKPVRIFEVLDQHTEESFPNLMEAMSHFKSGRTYYDKGKWTKALWPSTRRLP